ncbi:MAG: efflux RND transporter periplasmic adaptor subunit [Verrucomicrobia bacterium]|nr:efflux RND transporter periplasmic adaptor subunit [Verrucomicrobiota bacterium]
MKETRNRSPKTVVCLLIIALVAGGALWSLRKRSSDGDQALSGEILTAPALVGPFVEEIVESGEIESSSNVEVRCQVGTGSAGIALLEVVPEGTYVKPGDFLARVDDSNLKERLITRQIDVNMSQAALAQARADLENAKLELQEYESGLFREEEEKLESEEFVARENLRRAEEYLQYSENLAAKGYVSAVQLEADRFALEKASKELAVARTRLDVLRKYTKEKMLSGFTAKIETSAVQLSSAQKAYEIDKAQLDDVETQLKLCVIRAPSAGQVVYANDPSAETPLIQEGKMVREMQILFRLPDPKRMQMRAQVNESRIDKVRPGMPVRIRVEALPGGDLTGELVKLTEYPVRSANVYVSHIKNYGATILIDNPPEGLRPGMTAEATILLSEDAKALQVPIPAVVERDGRFFCVVAGAAGGPLRVREVAIGSANQQAIVIEAGLQEGEQVALSPSTFIDRLTLPDASELIARREPQRQAPAPGANPS